MIFRNVFRMCKTPGKTVEIGGQLLLINWLVSPSPVIVKHLKSYLEAVLTCISVPLLYCMVFGNHYRLKPIAS